MFSREPPIKAFYIFVLSSMLALMPHNAIAQRATATASATITNEHFSTQELRSKTNDEQAKNKGTYLQRNYQSEEKERPCNGRKGAKTSDEDSGKKDEEQCLILMIELH